MNRLNIYTHKISVDACFVKQLNILNVNSNLFLLLLGETKRTIFPSPSSDQVLKQAQKSEPFFVLYSVSRESKETRVNYGQRQSKIINNEFCILTCFFVILVHRRTVVPHNKPTFSVFFVGFRCHCKWSR